MFLLIEHLGLAEPERFTFCLRNSVQTSDGFQDVRGEGVNASSWVDGAARPGVDEITFVRQPFDALLADFWR